MVDTTTYHQPNERRSLTWTPGRVRAALATADGGELRIVADLCEELLGDERISSNLHTRTGGLLGLDLGFEDSLQAIKRRRKSQPDSRLVTALDDEGDWWRIAPEPEVLQIHIWGLLLGVCPVELVWPEEESATGRLVPRLKFWHPRDLKWDPRERKWFLRTDSHGTIQIDPGDGKWSLYMPYGVFRPWSHGLWRGLALWWLLKCYARDDWGRHSENASLLKVTASEGANPEHRAELASDLRSAGRDGKVALPPGYDIDLVEASANTRELYEAQIDTANTAFSIAIVGQNLTTDVDGGSFAAAKVHAKVEAQRVRNDGECLSTFLHDDVLAWYAEFNWGDARLAPWPAWDTEPADDVAAGAETLLKVAQAVQAFQAAGITLDHEEVREKYGVPIGAVALPPQSPQNRPRAASGFVEGQSYADALADRGAQRGARNAGPMLQQLLALVDDIDSLDAARERLLAYYGDESPEPEALAASAEKVFVLGQLGGLASILQDHPEAKD